MNKPRNKRKKDEAGVSAGEEEKIRAITLEVRSAVVGGNDCICDSVTELPS